MRTVGQRRWDWGRMPAPIAWCIVFSTVPLCAAEPLTIRLPQRVNVSAPDVRLADVAQLLGASPQEIERAARIDLLELDPNEGSATISQERIRLRLLLAGWDDRQLRFTGAPSVQVDSVPAERWSDRRIEHAIQQMLARVFGLNEQELEVRLAAPFLDTLPAALQGGENWRPDPLPPVRPALGHAAITIRLWRGEQLVGARLAHCNVLRKFRVPVAAAPLPQLHALTAADVRFEERFLTQAPTQVETQQLVDRRLRVPVQLGEMITDRHLLPNTAAASTPLIRPRDQVQVIARSGAVRVTLQAAEALQSGQPGEVIRLRNPSSNTIISGKVLADGQVEILLR